MKGEISEHRPTLGAVVRTVDLKQYKDKENIKWIKELLYKYKVVSFVDQEWSLEEYQLFVGLFGSYCENPYLIPLSNELPHVIKVERKAGEKVQDVSLYGGKWHSDFTMLSRPPDFTFLYSEIIPPVGGDTLFVDQQEVYSLLDDSLKQEIKNKSARHTAEIGWGIDGLFAKNQDKRTMKIDFDQSILSCDHSIVRIHEHSKLPSLYINQGFVSHINGYSKEDSDALMLKLFCKQCSISLVYKLKWAPRMLTIWDNRSVLHRATGGYEDYDRVMYRIVSYDD